MEQFTGKELDNEGLNLNLDYFGARYLDPAIGRWTTVDPLAKKYPGWSPYNYGLDDPLFIKDPNGKDDIIINKDHTYDIIKMKGPDRFMVESKATDKGNGASIASYRYIKLNSNSGIKALDNTPGLANYLISKGSGATQFQKGLAEGSLTRQGSKAVGIAMLKYAATSTAALSLLTTTAGIGNMAVGGGTALYEAAGGISLVSSGVKTSLQLAEVIKMEQ